MTLSAVLRFKSVSTSGIYPEMKSSNSFLELKHYTIRIRLASTPSGFQGSNLSMKG